MKWFVVLKHNERVNSVETRALILL